MDFYGRLLGFTVKIAWARPPTAVMLDRGRDYLEVFEDPSYRPGPNPAC